jgi:ABC-type multidrug transport system fused ATPase/permease subunit
MNLSVHDKLMKMTSSERRLFEEGDFMTICNVDVEIVTNFIKGFSVLFSAPTVLITTQVFLFVEAGKYGFIMLGVVILSLFFQILICWRVAVLGVVKLSYYQKRITFNIEAFSGLKQLKSLGWEELLTLRNQEMRKPENYYNKKCFLYNSIYNFIVGFVPPLIIFLILVIDLARSPTGSLSTTYIYTLISYIGLIYGPINSLPSTIVTAFQTATCGRRMDKLLAIEEISQRNQMQSQPGQLVIRNFIGCWNGIRQVVPGSQTEIAANNHEAPPSQFRLILNRTMNRASIGNPWDIYQRTADPAEQHDEFKIKIPYEIMVQTGQRLFVLGNNQSGKSSFFQSILGNLVCQYGLFDVGGRLGYVPQVPFIRRDTLKNNITFGSAEDSMKLDRVEDFVDMVP